MKGKNLLAVFLIASLLAGFSSQASAWWWRGKQKEEFRGSPQKMQKMIIKKLDLTDEQKKKFKAMEEETKKEMKASQEKLKEISEKLKVELQKDSPDRNLLHRYIGELSQIRTNMQIKRMDSMLDLREMLTPEQRKKFKRMLGQRKPPRGKRPLRKH